MHHRLISEGKTARRISQDQPGCEREKAREWGGGHCWLPGKQFVCLLSWCFVSGYSSLQSAHLGHVPLNGIYKTWYVFSQCPPPPPPTPPYMRAQHASVTTLRLIHFSEGFTFLLKQPTDSPRQLGPALQEVEQFELSKHITP